MMTNSKKKVPNNSPESLLRAILILGVIGTIVSVYLVKDHYNTRNSICDLGNHFSCSIINKSIFSELFKVPVAIFGTTWFLVLLGFTLKIKENQSDVCYWTTAHFIWSALGVVFCGYLIFAEFLLGAICPFCTVVHIICVIIMYLSWKIYTQLKAFPSFVDLVSYFFTKQPVWTALIAIIHILPLIYFNLPTTPPSATNLNSFAKCLADSGIVMYGSYECKFCNRQKDLFGLSFEHVNYVDCGEQALKCTERSVDVLPTWMHLSKDGAEIKRHSGLLTIKELSEFSSCPL